MSISRKVLKAGTRSSKLAIIQAKNAISQLQCWYSDLKINIIPFSSPGDRDKTTDLRNSPSDFFTRDLDEAIRDGKIDFAIHSAKDLPEPMPEWLDWFWLPYNEDQRDCIVLPIGKSLADMPNNPVIGISSERRAEYCRRRFPSATQKAIRGTIEERLQQLDSGSFDAIIMASAALIRLGLSNRITEYIPLTDLPPPAGQGFLAITFKKDDALFQKIRTLFVKPVAFAGAGAGD